jgi:hypothetical protein
MSSNPVERVRKAELEKLRHELAHEADAIRGLLAVSDKAEETKLAADLKIGERLAYARGRLREEKHGFWLLGSGSNFRCSRSRRRGGS